MSVVRLQFQPDLLNVDERRVDRRKGIEPTVQEVGLAECEMGMRNAIQFVL